MHITTWGGQHRISLLYQGELWLSIGRGGNWFFFISGETGSGKSESCRPATLELSVSIPGKKGSKHTSQVPASEPFFETFGNACTLFNPNASHFGKYTELQFSDHECLSGIKTPDYYLERNCWYAKGATKITKCTQALDQSIALWGSESAIWG